MRVSLINLGDGARAVYDIKNRFVSVPVGEIVSADLSDTTLKNIVKFQKTDTLLVGPEGSIAPPVRLRAALDILKVIETEPYDRLLVMFFDLVHPRSGADLRPNRGLMRAKVRGVIEEHLRAVQGRSDEKPMTHDDVGADELEKDLARQQGGTSRPTTPKKPKKRR